MNESIENYIKERTNNLADLESYKFNFGKYKGIKVSQVFAEDPQYLKFAFTKAKYRLSPKIHQFIVDNAKDISEAIKTQQRTELDVFSSFEDD